MSLTINAGEVVTLVGRNGMGKTTTVRSIMGLTPAQSGDITFAGQPIRGMRPEKVAAAGISLVPEGRRIFPNLSVTENLQAFARPGAWTLEKVFEQFPSLARRKANLGNQLSGGEQQMLAIGRALLRNGQLLIIDEATEGLAPLIRQEIWACLKRLKAEGMAILLIDKYLEPLLQIGDRHNVIDRGVVVWSGDSDALRKASDVWEKYVGV
ncbi:MAG: ABC transporter ATP-binding protein [Polaromonas sp.]|nr:ABC transporter ATP-binding protein [Polaromonas sp.]